MRYRPVGLVAAVIFLLPLSCTSADDPPTAIPVPTAPASASSYTIELLDPGAPDRHLLAAPLPVGRAADIVVSLGSTDETIEVSLEATLVRSDADGEGQLIELVVVGVDANDTAAADGLAPIIGASSRLVRDERLAVVEQELDVPDGLAFRADAVARQALRAPFVLAGPLVDLPVGSGASWTTQTDADGEASDATTVEVVRSTIDGYLLRFELADGSVEITGRPDELLPDEQVITLDDATIRIVAERSSQ